ncbi:MAG: hypothetical protein VW397_07690 [Candidatus Margulisiibacteriota bacterium]
MDISRNFSSINSGYLPANALDENNKIHKRNFEKELNHFMEELSIDQQISETEATRNTNLDKLNSFIDQLNLSIPHKDSEKLKEKISNLLLKLISELKNNRCNKTKKTIQDIFKKIKSTELTPKQKILLGQLNQI